jgi:hypothetical protein
MRRLEHACSGALTSPEPKLDIDLSGVTHVDETALAILQRLEARGIRVIKNELSICVRHGQQTRRQRSH